MSDPEHEHSYSPEMVRDMTARFERAVEQAKARDSQICTRCLHLGFAVSAIVTVEMLIEDGQDTPDIHAGLQMLYAHRDAYFGHKPEGVVQ